ncbi:MAG: ABC transporter permease [Candidatus Poseidoniaceae archaeon]
MADKTNTIFRALDRKASAITEFTMRQYRTKISTWVVLITGLVVISLLMLFYVDAMQRDFEAIDNDGDSVDSDGDLYPDGQERLYGTNPFSELSHPGLFDPPIPPDDPEKWINEDDFDWDESPTGTRTVSVGYDDDGDCRTDSRTSSQKDTNDNGIECDIELSLTLTGEFRYDSDSFVDEDPDDEAYAKEALHRASILGIGKLGFVFIISIFIPLFMATGLIRDEMTSGTMHYMLTKPIARTEVFFYRVIGYLGIVWPYLIILTLISAIVTGFAGPGDSLFRFSEFGIWLAILFAAMMATLVYGMLFCFLGVMWRYGIILAIPFAAWELGMALLSMGVPESPILRFSVIGWALIIVDAASMIVWPDMTLLIYSGFSVETTDSLGFEREELIGTDPLQYFYATPGLGDMSPFLSMIIATVVLLIQAAALLFIGGALFKGKEIE